MKPWKEGNDADKICDYRPEVIGPTVAAILDCEANFTQLTHAVGEMTKHSSTSFTLLIPANVAGNLPISIDCRTFLISYL
jgi:hypothetical protein